MKHIVITQEGRLQFICGSTGAGKNAMMYGMMHMIGTQDCTFMAVETPTETVLNAVVPRYIATANRNDLLEESCKFILLTSLIGAKHAFIEMYHNPATNDDITTLKALADTLDVNVHIGVQLARESNDRLQFLLRS